MKTAPWRLAPAAIVLAAGTMAFPTAADASADQYGVVRLVNAIADATDPSIETTMDGGTPAELPWVTASSWQVMPAGQHTVGVTVAGRPPAELVLDVPADCPMTVFLRLADEGSLAAVQSTVCGEDRIPAGAARISTVAQLEPDLGPVEVRLPGFVTVLAPGETTAQPVDVPAEAVSLAVGAPGSDEVYATVQPVLEEHASYTLLYAGGGETPATLTLLTDGRQAPAPPSPDTPIETGPPLPDGRGGGWIVLGVLLALARVTCWRDRPRRAAGPALLALAVLTCAGCGVPLVGSGAPPAGSGSPGGDPVPDMTTATTTPSAAPSSPTSGAGPGATDPPPTWPSGAAPTELDLPSLQQTWPLGRLPAEDLERLPGSLPLDAVAWLEGTSLVGTPGTTVVLAHTTAPGKTPGPFNRLGELRTSDRLAVRGDDGSVHEYIVASVDVAPKGDLPADLYAPQVVPVLLLISCTDVSGAPGSYRDNLVVTALGLEVD
jgi:hypothetical protein